MRGGVHAEKAREEKTPAPGKIKEGLVHEGGRESEGITARATKRARREV